MVRDNQNDIAAMKREHAAIIQGMIDSHRMEKDRNAESQAADQRRREQLEFALRQSEDIVAGKENDIKNLNSTIADLEVRRILQSPCPCEDCPNLTVF
jgi:hypothetical protein